MVFQAPTGPSFFQGLQILFVDGSADERELFRLRFELLGASVTAVATADEALEALQDGDMDLLVSDVVLAAVSGYELARRVRELPAERGGKIPAMAVTAFSSPRTADEALLAGFTVYLAKPYSTETLVGIVGGLMPQIEELRRARVRSAAYGPQAFRERLRTRRVQLQRSHATVLASNGSEQERHFAKKTLALIAAQDFGETHFCAPLDDVEVSAAGLRDGGGETWTATAVCGRELLTLELEIGPEGRVDVTRTEPINARIH